MPSNLLKTTIATGLMLALSGCFESSTQNSTDTKDADIQGTEIHIAMMVPPKTGLSPLSDDAFKLSRWSTAETLVELNDQAEALPKLATEWQQIDDLTWQFTLRDGVVFHDGSKLTAEMVINSIDKAFEAAPKPRIIDGINWQVRAVDDKTVEIKTDFNDPLLPSRLSSPQLAILAANAYLENGRINPTRAGSGPFVLTEINGATSAKLERYEDYWGEKAKIDRITAEYVPDGFARAAALRTGKADVVEAVPVSQLAMIDPELLHEVNMPRTNTLYLNNQSEVFSQLEMRKIATAAIDRKQIIETVYENRAAYAEGLLGPALAWAAPLRPEAPQLEQGLKANGEKVVLGTFTDRAELPEVAILVKQQLENAGFNVELDIREYGQIENDALAGNFDIFMLSRATVIDSGDPVAYMMSDFSCEGSYNLGQFCSKQVDAALTHADLQPLGEARQKAIIEAEQKILSEYAAIPLLHERVIQGESLRVKQAVRDPRERLMITEHTDVN
ncbi:ABC transporter substrate-binding protein [Photobacterium sp. DNB23_23_1]